MGYIYKLLAPNGKAYIGQTTSTTFKRWREHIYDAFDEKKNHCKVLNASIRKYGHENFTTETILECDNSLLNEKEAFYIFTLNTSCPNGLNIKQGGNNSRHREETKAKISASLKGKPKSYHQITTSAQSRKQSVLPMYVIEARRNTEIIGYRVCNHPNKGEKKFCNANKTRDENLEDALLYLKYLDQLTTPLEPSARQLPKHISHFKCGYRVRYMSHDKAFVSKVIGSQKNYERALSYLNQLQEKEQVQRLDGSGFKDTHP